MTHLDLSEKLREHVKDKNLQILPQQMKIDEEVRVNDAGQVIIANGEDQIFDTQAKIIDTSGKNEQSKGEHKRDPSTESNEAYFA